MCVAFDTAKHEGWDTLCNVL